MLTTGGELRKERNEEKKECFSNRCVISIHDFALDWEINGTLALIAIFK